MTEPEQPKPCPFCGGRACLYVSAFSLDIHYIRCESRRCGVRGPERKTAAGAIRAWNRRKEPSR